ncbi:LytR C-terminal domain-containing protein [Streptomyces benahoarensis]|uniref:LytR family transcriptional regulator n=1 Tax=Streptomyces benahoarensis TaxID=2595054 RepID=A0A553Y3U6_9ACTN|nr:LytR C-terminal domain-containing protein [Streptomyces benahoarensis]TSB20490.1 LytR family transcriptional regulator [Streptomyces benahoarensis]TSB23869.1 LytR family transcriptional regulator [Streptomyces benahoarensis]
MSMLTPPGMGGKKYRVTGDRHPRMRRPRHRRRIVLAAAAGICALGLVGWGTLQLIDVFGGTSGKAQAAEKGADAKQKCATATPTRPAAAKPPAPSDITVNVLNATPRGGLAKRTADELEKRGFDIGKVGNAPAAYDKKVKNNGVLLGPSGADGPLKVLATQLAGTRQETDGRKDRSVDLIIGDTFQDLTKAKDAEKALAALAHPPRPKAPAC